jgi:Cytochrome c
MFSRFRIALALALLASLLLIIPVFGGGWAVITLDELPTNVVVGEPLTIGFMIRQHGRTPMNDLAPTITANLYKEQKFIVDTKLDGKPGHYSATLTFPKEGDWNWSIQAFTMDQPMPTLTVAAPITGVVNQHIVESEPSVAPVSTLMIVRLSALGIGLAGLAFAFWCKSRMAVALTALCLLIGMGSFVATSAVPAVEVQSRLSSNAVNGLSISQVELGSRLFIAKGCITCHVNNKVARASDYWVIETGAPNLTNFSASPEALSLWLKDPSSVKPDTQMPNLNLSNAEIEALMVFINSE